MKMNSPIGARRMKTDLLTDTMIVHTNFATRSQNVPPPSQPHSPTGSRRSTTKTLPENSNRL